MNIVLGLILFVNLIDFGTTIYALRIARNLCIQEVGLLGTAAGDITNFNIVFHLLFSIFILVLCYYILLYKRTINNPNSKYILVLRIFIGVWLFSDTLVAINNIYWIIGG